MQAYNACMPSQSPQDRIARRIKWFREQRKQTQEQLSTAIGFNDRQTLASIEAGERRVSAEELVAVSRALNVELDAFLDPFRLVGEGQFSFRANLEAPAELVEEFAEQAGRWIATYRELGRQSGAEPKSLSYKLDLRRDSTFEEVQASAEWLWKHWELGDVPADRLQEAITRFLDVLVLYVDAPSGISGAASQLPGLRAILVNRREPRGRRNYDLAHELFHLLTWDAMPPERIEPQEIKATKGNRVEQLANNFAAALLMPEPVVSARWQNRGDIDVATWVLATASALRVSASALQWRLVNLKMMSKTAMRRLMNEVDGFDVLPLLFSAPFIERVHEAVESGRLSLRRAAGLLGLPLDAFADLCRSYGRPLSYDVAAQS